MAKLLNKVKKALSPEESNLINDIKSLVQQLEQLGGNSNYAGADMEASPAVDTDAEPDPDDPNEENEDQLSHGACQASNACFRYLSWIRNKARRSRPALIRGNMMGSQSSLLLVCQVQTMPERQPCQSTLNIAEAQIFLEVFRREVIVDPRSLLLKPIS